LADDLAVGGQINHRFKENPPKMNNPPRQGNHHHRGRASRGERSVTESADRVMGIPYFAYGSNLRARQMERLCPGHVFLGQARLADHRLAFTLPDEEWQGGVADVLPSPGDEVRGALYRLEAHHLTALDAYEVFDPDGPVEANDYVRRLVQVRHGGVMREAWCYFVRAPHGHVAPSERYRAALLEGAIERGLPADYVGEMRRAFGGGKQ
jgi:gamma-glutamylcyclotransferase (GGCT)/AIG2-like uncharacterized protein YtfP